MQPLQTTPDEGIERIRLYMCEVCGLRTPDYDSIYMFVFDDLHQRAQCLTCPVHPDERVLYREPICEHNWVED